MTENVRKNDDFGKEKKVNDETKKLYIYNGNNEKKE